MSYPKSAPPAAGTKNGTSLKPAGSLCCRVIPCFTREGFRWELQQKLRIRNRSRWYWTACKLPCPREPGNSIVARNFDSQCNVLLPGFGRIFPLLLSTMLARHGLAVRSSTPLLGALRMKHCVMPGRHRTQVKRARVMRAISGGKKRKRKRNKRQIKSFNRLWHSRIQSLHVFPPLLVLCPCSLHLQLPVPFLFPAFSCLRAILTGIRNT